MTAIPRRVAVIGAGVTGLVAAYRLTLAGVAPDVYERWPGLGGQAATLDVGGGDRLERYYHHLFMSDRHIAALYEELGMPDDLRWEPSSMAFFADGRSHAFTTPLDLLRFAPLSLRSRLRMGLAVLRLQRSGRDGASFEHESARAWIERSMGSEAYARVWQPLLRGKFGDRADDISMAWLHSKLTLRRQLEGEQARRELLGYPRGSFEPLFARLQREIERGGGRILIDRPAARLMRAPDGGVLVQAGAPGSFRIGLDPRRVEAAGEPVGYDAALATVPCDVFESLLDPPLAADLSPGYLDRLRSIEYHAAICVLLELDRSYTPFYWTNMADAEIPFVGLVEHTNLVDRAAYGGRRFLYIANYVSLHDGLLECSLDELLDRYEPALRRINPGWSRSWIRQAWLHREPAAQPIVDVAYRTRIPPIDTGARGLYLANTTQVYPEDRGTNYAVRLGDQAAAQLLALATGHAEVNHQRS
ncbi:MAG TPA: NAD(P)/FAD-dependent oxidoreductase [Solirubrobacteraceae bacterium]|nr:NAD(P)/FAD-dependent oxidoreductase [Solirubrobacteraceae bacterium]